MSAEHDLVAKLMSDDRIDSVEAVAYIMATIKHEADGKYLPIPEYGKGKGHKYGQPDQDTGQTYYGRGYVQITWKDNYATFGKLLNIDLVNNPDLALNPDIAYEIAVQGMLKGLFTGKKLSDYITDDNVDYVNARRIINGTDQAQLIAGYAEQFESALLSSKG